MTESEKKKTTSLRSLGLGYKRIAEQAGLSRDAVRSFLKKQTRNAVRQTTPNAFCAARLL